MHAKHFGKCALCGKLKELTFEHIPPNKAFNFTPAKPISGDSLLKAATDNNRLPWDHSGLKYLNQQQGMGLYSICQSCNNLTGAWYGDSYVDLTKRIHYLLKKEIPLDYHEVEFVIKEIYPQRIIKQVVSMFCSINQRHYLDTRFLLLREFVLDRDLVSLDKNKYKICMYLTRSNMCKYCGFTIKLGGKDMQHITAECMSEFCAYPLGFILYFEPDEKREFLGTDITHFSDYSYDEKVDFKISVPILENNTWIPEDSRSRAEIIETISKNNGKEEGK